MKRLYIDRIEEIYAICEDDECNVIQIPILNLPNEAKEGDTIILKNSNEIIIDKKCTHKRKSMIKKIQNEIWNNK